MDQMVLRGRTADEDEFEVGSDHPALEAPPARRRGRWLGTTPWVLAAAALVVTGVAVAPDQGLPLDGYPSGTVGMLAVDATVPPEEMWRAPIEEWRGGPQWLSVVGETVVLLTGDHAEGLSLTTGEARWRVPVDIQTCTVREAVACLEQQGQPGARVVRIDPTTGDQHRIDLPYAVEAVAFGDDLLALTERDDELELQRVDAAGRPRWVSTADLSDVTTAEDTIEYASFAELVVLGEQVYLSLAVVSFVVDVATGANIERADVSVHDSVYGYIRYDSASSTSTLLDDDGNVLVEDLPVAPDDDPHGAYEVRWDGLHLSIASDGEAIWESEVEQDDVELPLARVDGVLVTRTNRESSDRLAARDLGTGDVLWTTAADAATSVLGAAGSTLLMMGSHHALAGVDAHSGEALWTYGDTYPTGGMVFQPDGVLLLLDNEVVRLAWDRAGTAVW
ncbi:outer membrane protein assembly factor BamB family protein [Pseudactinotalea suaedae]|uniref:outer membrane protein assembly factor BamB family protein n=1 Tax=Pseudactinotalea suaedae TaxID=1524924 RepID=UPI0012E24CD5|nr:PQQ-binding-like beta-propeller repeat protein [Pseudactinotalea suaedae]